MMLRFEHLFGLGELLQLRLTGGSVRGNSAGIGRKAIKPVVGQSKATSSNCSNDHERHRKDDAEICRC